MSEGCRTELTFPPFGIFTKFWFGDLFCDLLTHWTPLTDIIFFVDIAQVNVSRANVFYNTSTKKRREVILAGCKKINVAHCLMCFCGTIA